MPEDKIKVAICIKDNSVDSKMDELFGRAPYFIIYTLEDKKIKTYEIIKNESLLQTGKAGISTAKILVEMNVKFVICRNIGPRAQDVLEQFGIIILTTSEGSAKNAIEAFLKNK